MLGATGSASTATTTTTTVHADVANVTSATSSRAGRKRGLSYLRNYTQQHLTALTSRADAPPLLRSTSSPDASFRQDIQQNQQDGPQVGLGLGNRREDSQGADSELNTMTRSRNAANGPAVTDMRTSHTRRIADEDIVNVTPGSISTPTTNGKTQQPTIRFSPHTDGRSSRPSLHFSAISRTLHSPTSVIRVGRYSERDHLTSDPTALPVGFKSKVVSRRHCEFWCVDGQWYVKDVKSSSGTFLNHVRLSAPNTESKRFPINDGDVVQLGIDFKGGEEIIFRCVKIRVECNRGWQKSLNTFNTSAHKRLFKSATKSKNRDSDAGSVSSSECSICLIAVAPCQALFVSPCGHVWHYKCIRTVIQGPNYPNFLCPNCRAVADLEADVEPPEDFDEDDEDDDLFADQENPSVAGASNSQPGSSDEQSNINHVIDGDGEHDDSDHDPVDHLVERLEETSLNHSRQHPPTFGRVQQEGSQTSINDISEPIPISPTPVQNGTSRSADAAGFGARSTTPTTTAPFSLSAMSPPMVDAMMTPRNNAGPFVFDGANSQETENN